MMVIQMFHLTLLLLNKRRLCGVANLKMELPHFGESVGDDELGDFIKFTNRDSNGIKQQRKRLSRMQSPY